MAVRILKKGCKGEDVRAVQNALNRNGASLNPDADFGDNTRDAVIAFQKKQHESNAKFQVDGEVGPETRRALFPLIGVTVSVYGMRLTNPSLGPIRGANKPWFQLPPPTPGQPTLQSQPRLNLNLPPTVTTLTPERIPGLLEPIALPPVLSTGASSKVTWQQIAQTQRQFTGFFRGPVVDTFAIGAQTVFMKSDTDNHLELTTGCLLQSPIGFQDKQGNNFTIACFANATWVDPIFHLGMFHLANPYAQVQAQGNTGGPTLPTVQLSAFPVNINVDLNADGLQFNFTGGAAWNLLFDGGTIKSSWGTQVGLGLVGKFNLF